MAVGAGDTARPTAAATPPDGPSQLRLAWSSDPTTTMTIRWRFSGAAELRWRPLGSAAWTRQAPGQLADPEQWEVVISGLLPGQDYEYALAFDGVVSPVRTFTTAPSAGAPVRLAFVADTGVAGRLDGLTTGTDRVLEELAAGEPLAVLAGGDFAYLNSEDRYDDQAAAMDGWFEMMEPLASTSALMPAYGNHEVVLGESVTEWRDRFATPSGSPDGLSYSFDVGGIHVVSLLAYEQRVDPATYDWLVADLGAARERGAREIVPFLHRNLYGNGTVHPPSGVLADQLAPVFEDHGVRLVLTAHDQSFERTYPLLAGAPATQEIDCFDAAAGITYVKSSPGGKLSNENWDFSGYDGPADPQIAVRENGLHHYTFIDFDASDGFTVDTYGLVGDGSEPVLVDSFTYGSTCVQRPVVTPSSVYIRTDETTTEVLQTDEPSTFRSNVDWVSVDETGRVDVGELATGRHAATVTVTNATGGSTSVPIVIVVPPDDVDGEFVVASAVGDEPVRLDGAVLGGDVHVQFRPRETLSEVRFALDGAPFRSDREPPFELTADEDGAATPLDTTTLVPGVHQLTAYAVGGDGAVREVRATFTVDPAAPLLQPVPSVPTDRTMPASEVGPQRLGDAGGWREGLPLGLAVASAGALVGLLSWRMLRGRPTDPPGGAATRWRPGQRWSSGDRRAQTNNLD